MTQDDLSLAPSAGTLEKVKGEIVTQTLDTLASDTYATGKKKQGNASDISDSYHFQKSVLDAAYMDKGSAITTKT